MIIAIRNSIIGFLLYTDLLLPIHGQGDALVQPDTIESSNGVLDIELTLEYGDYSHTGLTLTGTRLFNGILPGQTIILRPGDTMRILFQNNLEEQESAVTSSGGTTGNNVFKLPDTSNLHWHGLHVPGELPSDDVRFEVGPGEEYQYITTLPDNHMGGTHWMHPHVHGSSTLQVAGGAAAALIVTDDNEENDLPTEVTDADEVVLVIQDMNPEEIAEVSQASGDGMTSVSSSLSEERWFIVNGQFQPDYAMTTNTWYRFRIIHAGFEDETTGLTITGCEMQLLAKDGIYISDFPRAVNSLPIPSGGRADVMVRCATASTYTMRDYDSLTVMTLTVSGSDGGASTLPGWTVNYPDYLTDLTNTASTNGCSCSTSLQGCENGFCINGQQFDVTEYIHTIEFGSIVERQLQGINNHVYHQHVYPLQLVDEGPGFSGDDATYWRVGDWADTIIIDSAGQVTTRYTADVHTGVVMVHCHVLEHEDQGMMSQELIGDSGTVSCGCDVRPGPTLSEQVADSIPGTESILLPTDSSSSCFSSVATAMVENKGQIYVKDIQVGDKVLTAGGNYETVYTVDHKNPTKRTRFLQIYSEETSSPLEITDHHMVFVNDTKTAIPASRINVGDKIQLLDGISTVTKISHIIRDGIWNPITSDGTIVVDGVVASTYSLAIGKENIHILGLDLMSQHDFIHLLMTPYRAMCLGLSLSLCESSHELNAYSQLGTILLNFALKQNNFVQDLMTVILLAAFGFMYLVTLPFTICVGFGALCFFLAKKERKSTHC